MKTTSRLGSLTRSLKGLLGTNKPNKTNITRLNRKEDYYRDYYFDKKLSDGIELFAAFERTSKKNAATQLMRAGVASYMVENVRRYIADPQETMLLNEGMQRRRFIRIYKKYAKAQGVDISKLTISKLI